MQCGAVWCGVVRCGAVRCVVMWCGAVRCGAVNSLPVVERNRRDWYSAAIYQLVFTATFFDDPTQSRAGTMLDVRPKRASLAVWAVLSVLTYPIPSLTMLLSSFSRLLPCLTSSRRCRARARCLVGASSGSSLGLARWCRQFCSASPLFCGSGGSGKKSVVWQPILHPRSFPPKTLAPCPHHSLV